MSEILKAAFAKPKALSQNKNWFMVDQETLAKYRWDLYPIGDVYYHEFNPYLVHTIPEESAKVFPEFTVFTVRDGYITFADFLLTYWREIPKWKTHFLVPASYAPLIPENLAPYFLSYSTTQLLKPDLKSAKKVLIFGLLTDYYFGNYEEVEKKLLPLKDLGPDVRVDISLALRRNPLFTTETENHHHIIVPEIVRKVLGDRKVNWVKTNALMDQSVMKDCVLFDLIHDQRLICDSYLHFWFLMRGGAIQGVPQWTGEASLFDLDLSFNQKLHVHPLPKVKCNFADLLYFAKTNKGELWNHSAFHKAVTRAMKSELSAT